MKKALKISLVALSVIVIISTLPYYKTNIYNFEEPQAFSGSTFYNPYQNLDKNWYKANFHAHSKLHFGLANGDNTPKELYTVYDSMNYQLPCISNYNSILPNTYKRHPFLSAYEHGLNGGAIHQLVLNNQTAKAFDFPFWQTKHHKQYIINNQKNAQNIIVLAHPNFKTGYSKADLAVLSNYQLFEVVSPRATSVDLWDQALSNGHAVWASGNDDAHHTRFGGCGVCWNMINSDTNSTEALLQSLKAGKSFATRGWVGQNMNQLQSLSTDSNIYKLTLHHASDSIILKSDHGKTVAVASNTNTIRYKIEDDNSYIRAEIFDTEEWNAYTRIYLNPVIRMQGSKFVQHKNIPQINSIKSNVFKMGLLTVHLLILMLALLFFRKK
jgi:hypothetical protein